MKFFLELPINRPRAEVWKIFDDPQNIVNWQPTLTQVENVSGTQGQPGAVSKLSYSENGREFFLTEKIIHRAEPDQLDSLYENNFADNTIKNTFIAVDENETLWKVEVTYAFKTILMKIMGPVMKKNLVARTQRDMERFKEFVEKI